MYLMKGNTSGTDYIDNMDYSKMSSAGKEGFGTVMRRNPQTGILEEVEYSQRSVHSS